MDLTNSELEIFAQQRAGRSSIDLYFWIIDRMAKRLSIIEAMEATDNEGLRGFCPDSESGFQAFDRRKPSLPANWQPPKATSKTCALSPSKNLEWNCQTDAPVAAKIFSRFFAFAQNLCLTLIDGGA